MSAKTYFAKGLGALSLGGTVDLNLKDPKVSSTGKTFVLGSKQESVPVEMEDGTLAIARVQTIVTIAAAK